MRENIDYYNIQVKNVNSVNLVNICVAFFQHLKVFSTTLVIDRGNVGQSKDVSRSFMKPKKSTKRAGFTVFSGK